MCPEMMKTLLLVAVLLGIGGLLSFVVMAAISRKGSAPGLVDGRLAPLPETPNAHLATFPIPEGTDGKAAIQSALGQLPGTRVVAETGPYLAAESRTGLFGFVDDVEVLIDEAAGELHVRSASRMGHSDLGANEKRVARLRELFEATQ